MTSTHETTDFADLVADAAANDEAEKKRRRPKRSAPKVKADPLASPYPNPDRPSALFLPESVRERIETRKLVRKILVGGVALVAVVGAAYGGLVYLESDATSSSQAILAEEQQTNDAISALAPVGDFYDTYSQQRAQAADSIASDVAYSRVLGAVAALRPDGVTISSFTAEYGDRNPGASPFETPNAIGAVTVEGTGENLESITEFMANLSTAATAPDAIVVQPYLTSTSGSLNSDTVVYQITMNFTAAAYSGRGAGVLGEDLPTPPVTFDTADPNAVTN